MDGFDGFTLTESAGIHFDTSIGIFGNLGGVADEVQPAAGLDQFGINGLRYKEFNTTNTNATKYELLDYIETLKSCPCDHYIKSNFVNINVGNGYDAFKPFSILPGVSCLNDTDSPGNMFLGGNITFDAQGKRDARFLIRGPNINLELFQATNFIYPKGSEYVITYLLDNLLLDPVNFIKGVLIVNTASISFSRTEVKIINSGNVDFFFSENKKLTLFDRCQKRVCCKFANATRGWHDTEECVEHGGLVLTGTDCAGVIDSSDYTLVLMIGACLIASGIAIYYWFFKKN
jgi:hypothetical protein